MYDENTIVCIIVETQNLLQQSFYLLKVVLFKIKWHQCVSPTEVRSSNFSLLHHETETQLKTVILYGKKVSVVKGFCSANTGLHNTVQSGSK